eukprot:gene5191-18415_t
MATSEQTETLERNFRAHSEGMGRSIRPLLAEDEQRMKQHSTDASRTPTPPNQTLVSHEQPASSALTPLAEDHAPPEVSGQPGTLNPTAPGNSTDPTKDPTHAEPEDLPADPGPRAALQPRSADPQDPPDNPGPPDALQPGLPDPQDPPAGPGPPDTWVNPPADPHEPPADPHDPSADPQNPPADPKDPPADPQDPPNDQGHPLPLQPAESMFVDANEEWIPDMMDVLLELDFGEKGEDWELEQRPHVVQGAEEEESMDSMEVRLLGYPTYVR